MRPKTADVIWTHSDDVIKVVETLNEIVTNPDAVIKIVKFKILLKKLAEIETWLDCPFSEARQLLIMRGMQND